MKVGIPAITLRSSLDKEGGEREQSSKYDQTEGNQPAFEQGGMIEDESGFSSEPVDNKDAIQKKKE